MKPKVIALYLPQYHQIPENDEFWGKGFTDWVTVKNAKPLFEGHRQPHVPLHENYYDLSKAESVEWQAKLAKENGIYGFGVYHYWFNTEKNLLTRPAEILRDSDKGYVKYFFVWDNTNWKRSWSNVAGNDWAPIADNSISKKTGEKILIPYILGGKPEWKAHYDYCKTHFNSPNYEKHENKPIFCIFNYSKELDAMCDYWNILAREDGFDGIFFVFKYMSLIGIPKDANCFLYEPNYVGWTKLSFSRIYDKILRKIGINTSKETMRLYDYDQIWNKIIRHAKKHPQKNIIHGGFVNYDDSPRRGNRNSRVIVGSDPQKFKKYFAELLDIAGSQNKDYVFLTAWNEWGESAFLEPDVDNGLGYLEAIKKTMSE